MKYEVNYQTEECPVCKSNWLASIGPNGERYKRSFCHYSQEYDRTVAMSCPDCGVVFKIKDRHVYGEFEYDSTDYSFTAPQIEEEN